MISSPSGGFFDTFGISRKLLWYNWGMKHEDLADRKRYSYWTPVTLRYGDTDSLGHINNAVFTTLFESGRAALLFDREGAIAGAGKTFVIVNLNVNFTGEMHYPGTVEVGTAVDSFGNSSVKLVQGLFKDGICCATSHSTIVLIDESTRRPISIPQDIRKLIASAAGDEDLLSTKCGSKE
ncbi:MAG TPA: thioesterase family protein [Candidatus Obscuribacterales bacterium]